MKKPTGYAIVLSALVLSLAISVAQAQVIDGLVLGFAEGYLSGYHAAFDIENGPSGVGGGFLFLGETPDAYQVGLIIPLIACDNTYGNTRASDWGSIEHYLIGGGGGKSLEGSDKWEFKYGDIEMKLDYIDEDGGAYNSRIEKLKQGGTDLDQSGLTFASSLGYNHNDLGLTQYFGSKDDDEDGTPIDSPASMVGDYNYGAPAEDWVSEIMYEFSLDKDVFAGNWFRFEDSVIHCSPNKLGDHKLFPRYGEELTSPVPEPSTWLLISLGGLLGLSRLRKKLKA